MASSTIPLTPPRTIVPVPAPRPPTPAETTSTLGIVRALVTEVAPADDAARSSITTDEDSNSKHRVVRIETSRGVERPRRTTCYLLCSDDRGLATMPAASAYRFPR